MIDWHCHILPGIDDGPIDIDESLVMAARLAEFGYHTVCCTPHRIKGYYDHSQQQVREATMLLQADLDNAGIPLELWPGIEYMLDENFAASATVPMPLGDTRLVLCEAPQQVEPAVVTAGLQRILAAGKIPLIAHPERTQYFHEMLTGRGTRDEETIVTDTIGEFADSRLPGYGAHKPFWKKLLHFNRNNSKFKIQNSKFPPAEEAQRLPVGCLYHANLGSFTGFYGAEVQRRAYQLLKAKAYCCIASDLHDSRSAAQVLARDKFETNPLLQKLAEFSGKVAGLPVCGQSGQGELF